mgnify:CR=1 FL=1
MPLKRLLKRIILLPDLFRCLMNTFFLKQNLLNKYSVLHLGCGDIRLTNCINVDYRATHATDITHDCSNLEIFPEKSFSAVYSNAFFEHLYINQRIPCLKSIYRVLKDDGFVMFTGIPDFKNVARAYLNKEKITDSKVFDLDMVYRFTHGKPERCPAWWLAQLHKSLFDKEIISDLLRESNFVNSVIFKYRTVSENIPVSLGFIGFKQKSRYKTSMSWLKQQLKHYSKTIQYDTIAVAR